MPVKLLEAVFALAGICCILFFHVAGNFRHIMGREHTLLNRCHNPFFKIYAIDEFVGAVLARYTFLSVTAIVTVLFSGSMYSMAVHRATAVLAEYLAG